MPPPVPDDLGRDHLVPAAVVLTPDGPRRSAAVRIAGGRIVGVEAAAGPVPPVVVAPGFVDLQVNGVADVDVATARGADWARAGRALAATGVTAWLPTVVSRPLDGYDAVLGPIAAAAGDGDGGPAILGAHLEGPFLGERPGAHRTEHLVAVDLDWLDAVPPIVRLVTLAPELPDALDAIELLAGRGTVVSLGHSAADHDTAVRAADRGARMVTHLFNAMGPLHHRRPGIVGAALADDRFVVGLIADGVHVHPALLRTTFRAKGAERVALVSDSVAVAAGGGAGGAGRLAGAEVTVVDGAPRLPDGTLAGSVLTMDAAVRIVVDAGVPLADALVAASTTPATVLGDPERGAIRPGARADLVTLDADDLSVVRTTIGGRTAWEA